MPRTITDIIPPSKRRPMGEPVEQGEAPPTYEPPQLPPRPPLYTPPRRRRFPWGTALVAVVVVLVCIGIMYAFAGAKVAVDPTTNTGAVSGTFTATPNTGDLSFALVNVQKTATESIPAESSVTANDSAQGLITVYNTQTKAQPLVTNTRFSTPSGLVYRIHAPITVPAASGGTPGSLEVMVYADQPGSSYNIGATSFTLPGLANSPQATEVYAKSTAPMTGGFSGTRPAVSQATDDAEHAKLQSTLSGEITSEVAPQVPAGYVLVPGSVFVTYSTVPDAADATTTGNVAVSEQANATAVIFPADALAKAIAPTVIGNYYTGEPITLEGVNSLALTSAATSTPTMAAPFSFSLSGNATLVWKVDPTKVAGAVAGKSRAAAQSVLTGFPEIQKASLTLRPFWKGTFPSDPADITVTVNTPSGS